MSRPPPPPPRSCDTFVVVGGHGGPSCTLFGKNSDRPSVEAHEVVAFPAATHADGLTVKCTHITIPQARSTSVGCCETVPPCVLLTMGHGCALSSCHVLQYSDALPRRPTIIFTPCQHHNVRVTHCHNVPYLDVIHITAHTQHTTHTQHNTHHTFVQLCGGSLPPGVAVGMRDGCQRTGRGWGQRGSDNATGGHTG